MEVKKITADEFAYLEIKNDIISGFFKSGERLLEAEIAKRLNVSRAPVREAFKRLEKEGYLTREPYKGMMVRKYTFKELSDYYQIRAVLDGLCAYLVTKKNDQELNDFLIKNIQVSDEAVAKSNFQLLAKLNNELHIRLAESSDNNLLFRMMENLWACSSIVRIANWSLPNRPTEVVEEHKQIVDAIIKGKKLLAAKKAFTHVINSYKHVKKIYKDNQYLG